MNLLIVQLSDIHIKGMKDKVFTRGKRVAEAVRNLTNKVDLCIVAVTGDIAYSGTIEQYADSLELLEILRVELPISLNGCRVEFIAIPGNHDCDFTLSNRVRTSILRTIKQDEEIDDSIIDIATSVQRDFFLLHKLYFGRHLKMSNKIQWDYVFDHEGYSIIFNCFNTAWVSELAEKPGTMFYPVEYIPEHNQQQDLAVAMFHHPYNWLSPDNAREFHKRIEKLSDIIITGHEHDATARATRALGQAESTHIESGALQDSYNSATSEFNCILIDTHLIKRAILPFKWSGERYFSTYSIDSRWESYSINPARSANTFGLHQDKQEWLEDLGLQVKHPSKGTLKRDDIFIFPDLLEMGVRQRSMPRMAQEEDFYEYVSATGKVIITGTSDSGKTTLGKEIFKYYYNKDLVPLYIDGGTGKTFSLVDNRLVTFLGRECEHTYNSLDAEAYRQLPKEKRVLIIDDFDKINFKGENVGKRSVREILDFLSDFAGTLILLANDIAIQASEAIKGGLSFITEGEAAFKQYRIQPFGHRLREQLVEQWFALDLEFIDYEDSYKKIDEVKKLLDTVIGNNFIPPYPVILLPLLQASQYHEPVNTNASTYGYFYELLIIKALSERTSKISMDIKAGYLTNFAKYIFEKGVTKLSDSEMLTFHQEYQADFDIKVVYRDIMSTLTEANLLELDGEYTMFKYDYIFYYFIASSLRNHLSESPTRETIRKLAMTLHEDLSANILLFLTHFTKDSLIIEEMLNVASSVFPDDSNLTAINNLSVLAGMQEVQNNIFLDQDVKASRQLKNRRLDELATQSESISSSDSNKISDENMMPVHSPEEEDLALTEGQEAYMQKISVAMKTLQILGQLLKNYVGTMDGPTKNRLVKECIGIGMRTLGSLLQSLTPHREYFISTMADIFKEEDPNLSVIGAKTKAIQSLFQVVHNNTYGTIRRISNAIGSPLLMPVYDRLVEQDSSPAIRMIHTALYFDNTTKFPLPILKDAYEEVKDIPLWYSILRSFTFNQFYTFNIATPTKQAACSLLKVHYTPQLGANTSQRLIKK